MGEHRKGPTKVPESSVNSSWDILPADSHLGSKVGEWRVVAIRAFPHEEDAFFGEHLQGGQARKAEERQDKKEQAHPILKAGDVVAVREAKSAKIIRHLRDVGEVSRDVGKEEAT